jgi:hypothetical protein
MNSGSITPSSAAIPARRLSTSQRQLLDNLGEASMAAGSFDLGISSGEKWLNVRPDPIDFRDKIYAPSMIPLKSTLDPPPDLRKLDVHHQDALPFCTGMALATAIDLLRLRRQSASSEDVNKRVSYRMLFEMGRGYDEHSDDGLGGSSLRGVIRGFFHNGVCFKDSDDDGLNAVSWSYTIDRAKEARKTTLGTYARLNHILLDYHSALNEVGVIVASTFVHKGWPNPDSNTQKGLGRIDWDGTQELIGNGGHAIAIVGYDEHGFLIRNSWGEDWSCWKGCPGILHWSYDDWQDNVMDAWVINLAVTTSHDARSIGGRLESSAVRPAYLRGRGSRGSPPRILVNGHYINIRDGKLVARPPFNSDQSSIEDTAKLLQETIKYDHLLFFVEGGLDDLTTMVDRAQILIPLLKANRIYPIFIWWREGCFEQLSEILDDRARRLEPKSGGLKALSSMMLESFALDFLQPFWRTFEGEAERAFTSVDKQRGKARKAILALINAACQNKEPMKVHALAHSAGAVWLEKLLEVLIDEGSESSQRYRQQSQGEAEALSANLYEGLFETISLLAPICSSQAFMDERVGKLYADCANTIGIYTLREAQDLEDRVGAYCGSLLRLAQRVFPVDNNINSGRRIVQEILGDEKTAHKAQRRKRARWFPVNHRDISSLCCTHRDLVSDLSILNHIFGRVIGKPDARLKLVDHLHL